jgi:hypothetical protein
MDNVENSNAPATELDALRAEGESLRHLIGSLLILLVIISGTLNLFFLREYRSAKTELQTYAPQARNLIGNYQKNDGPGIENFLRRIVEYGRAHPDFAPILLKYGINSPAGPAAAPAAAAPAPMPSHASPAVPPAAAPKKK